MNTLIATLTYLAIMATAGLIVIRIIKATDR